MQTLDDFVGGSDVEVVISGFSQSTAVGSLLEAFESLNITATLPALKANLLNSASLEVLPTTGHADDVAHATVSLANPFTASINLLEVNAVATFGNLTLGRINHVDRSSSPIHADGHTNITSPTLPFEFNLDPVSIIKLLFTGAQNNHVDLGPLPSVFQIVLANPGAKTGVRVAPLIGARIINAL